MAMFVPYAEVVAPDHPWAQVPTVSSTSRGILLQDLLQRSGGAYQAKAALSRGFRDELRRLGQRTSNETLLHLAGVPEVTVSLENLRFLDPKTTHVAVGYRIIYTDEESKILNHG